MLERGASTYGSFLGGGAAGNASAAATHQLQLLKMG